jgi:FKBP-type peptidyl-prolyl cis-trans isomerase FklB
MNRILITITLALCLPLHAATASAAAPAAPAPAPTVVVPGAPAAGPPSADAALSFQVGVVLGNQLRQSGFRPDVDLEELKRGVKEGLGSRNATAEERTAIAMAMRGLRESQVSGNRAKARAFLATNAKVTGVKTTASGLQYVVSSEGVAGGKSPTLTDRVSVRYRGRLIDGTQFDSSDSHGQSTQLGLSDVVAGWREALLMMKPGASWQLFVPPELAYGDQAVGTIPPGSLLIFDLELLSIDAAPTVTKPAGASSAPPAKPAVAKPATPAPATAPAPASAPAKK